VARLTSTAPGVINGSVGAQNAGADFVVIGTVMEEGPQGDLEAFVEAVK